MRTLDAGVAGLVFQRVSFGYPRREAVLSNLSWALPPGRVLLLGPNGAGKSTLLQLGAGLLRPRSGRIEGVVPEQVGYMPQSIRAVPGLTVEEQVAYVGWLAGLPRHEARRRAGEALAAVELDDRMTERASLLSGGQLRRVGVAEALMGDVCLLLLDEPTAGLDPQQRDILYELLMSLQVPFVVATHQVERIDDVYDSVVVLHRGQVRFEGSVDAFARLDPRGARDPHRAYTAVIGRRNR